MTEVFEFVHFWLMDCIYSCLNLYKKIVHCIMKYLRVIIIFYLDNKARYLNVELNAFNSTLSYAYRRAVFFCSQFDNRVPFFCQNLKYVRVQSKHSVFCFCHKNIFLHRFWSESKMVPLRRATIISNMLFLRTDIYKHAVMPKARWFQTIA